jgi:hypothetical protein
MATWPGLLNIALVAAANELVYGLAATALSQASGLDPRVELADGACEQLRPCPLR